MKIEKVKPSSIVGSSLMIMDGKKGCVAVLAVLNAGERSEEIADYVAEVSDERALIVRTIEFIKTLGYKFGTPTCDAIVYGVIEKTLHERHLRRES